MATITIEVPLNRVEGDLEIRAAIEGGVVVDAWSAGTMFRGFENILRDRGALDGLVLTPRICGLCSTAHLSAASRALDAVAGVSAPANGVRVRNVALMAENIQSDLRQAFLMFCVDFTNPAYERLPLYEEAVRRYQPFAGSAVVATLRATKRILEIVAVLGGQWPHSAFMVPGGVASIPTPLEIQRCRQILAEYRDDYERRVLGCSIERWREVKSAADLDAWLDEAPAHRDGEVGFFLRFGRAAGLDQIGRGHGHFLSVGGLESPDGEAPVLPAGFARGGDPGAFAQERVAEHVACSWFVDYDGGRHPSVGETRPYATGGEGKKYSWTKAPRYDGLPAEVGPLAELVVARDPLFTDLVGRRGPNALYRELARIARPATAMPAMDAWLRAMAAQATPFCLPEVEVKDGEGIGLVEAARGALGHWIKVERGRIARYQVITPTAWNGSPRDSGGVRGPWEEALIGTPVADPENPVALGHVVRSFDPCLVCTVHTVERGRPVGSFRLGI